MTDLDLPMLELAEPAMVGLQLDGDVGWASPIGIYDIVSLPLAFDPKR